MSSAAPMVQTEVSNTQAAQKTPQKFGLTCRGNHGNDESSRESAGTAEVIFKACFFQTLGQQRRNSEAILIVGM